MSEFRGFRDSDIQESKPRVQRFQGFRYLGELTKSSEVSGIQIFRRVTQKFRRFKDSFISESCPRVQKFKGIQIFWKVIPTFLS